jgi:phenylalanyl-tRNA synthetase alpha chain
VSGPVPQLSPAQLQAALGIRDLSDPRGGPHAIQLLVDRAVEVLSRAWSCEVRWCRGPKIVPVADNYDHLGYAVGAITRESRYTRYVSARRMLRSHSSAMVPPALRRLARDQLAWGAGDDVLGLPGDGVPQGRHRLAAQRDSASARPVADHPPAVTDADLDEMISCLLKALIPGLPYRQEPRTHPYTRHGRQVDVRQDGRWVEVWECGLAHPGVLAAAGLPGRARRTCSSAWCSGTWRRR